MGEILGIGMTHAPHLQFTDENMANVLKRLLKSERTPAAMKEPSNWPAGMRAEWGSDEGLTAARKHRTELLEGVRAARAALDAFKPDLVLIWGDDQYENFHEDLLPPFCIYAFDEVDCAPFKASDGLGAAANVWNEPVDTLIKIKGHREAANLIASRLLETGFDVAWSYRLHHAKVLSHAFTRTILYLDYDRRGFPYPVIPFHVNCYGSDLRIKKVSIEGRPPPAPAPSRCYDLGKQIARIIEDSPWRVALIGSSSWSHGTLTAKHHFLYPDMEVDRQRFAELQAGELHRWRDLDGAQMRASGQHEMLNWLCLAGAMAGRESSLELFVESYIFNSDKAMVLFPPHTGDAKAGI